MITQKFSLRQRGKSIRYAWQGICAFFRTQHNAVIHLAFTSMVIIAAFYFQTTAIENIALVIVTGLVWVAEIFNTAIEKLADLYSTSYNPQIKFIKDVAAAAVLVTAFIAVITGCLIFIPKIF